MSGILTFFTGALGAGGIGFVTSNLTSWTDVNNPVSFPGFGNTWYNISNSASNIVANANTNYWLVDGSPSRYEYTEDTTSGGSMVFTVNGRYPSMIQGTPLGTNSNSWTLETWVRWAGNITATSNGNTTANRLALMGERYGNNKVGYELTFETTNGGSPTNINANIKVGTYNGTYNYTDANVANYRVYPGEWYHVVGTQAPVNATHQTMTLYINGNVAGQQLQTNWGADGGDIRLNMMLSQDTQAVGTGNAAIAITRTYNRALGQSEVVRNYNSEKNRFVGGSYSFNGTGANLQVPAGTNWQFGTGSYTVEWFANYTAADTNERYFYSVGEANATVTGTYVSIQNTGTPGESRVRLVAATGTTVLDYTGTGLSNTWNNYTVARNGTNTTLYINGQIAQSNITDTTNISNTASPLRVGIDASQTSAKSFTGAMTNFRVTKGTALYTDTFSPTVLPFNSDAIANCQLSLLATDNVAWNSDSSPRTTPQTVTTGAVTWSNSTPFTPTRRLAAFNCTGSIQSWTAPAGVTNATVAVVGAAGGWGANAFASAVGGAGTSIVANLEVTPGQTYHLVVGGMSSNRVPLYGGGGYGGTSVTAGQAGGAGGGMSGIFTTSTPSQANAIIVAGGGGGGCDGGGFWGVGGAAAGSNTATAVYNNQAVYRRAGQNGQQAGSGYGFSYGGGAGTQIPITSATSNLAANTITLTLTNTSASYPWFSSGDLTNRQATIGSGTSVGTTYTLNYTAGGTTANIKYFPGQVIRISGANNANYNGTWTVSSSTNTSVSWSGTVSGGGSANAQGTIFSLWQTGLVTISGADNANYNGTYCISSSSNTQIVLFDLSGTNRGTYTGSNGTISLGGMQGNVFDTHVLGGWPEIGTTMQGGNGGGGTTGYGGGGGGGGGYWGGGGGPAGGAAKGAGGGGGSYWGGPGVANVLYVGEMDIRGTPGAPTGNGMIIISY